MSAVAVLQARAGSTRLPGKVLAELGGRPMLELALSRLAPLTAAGVPLVLATTVHGRDDPVAEVGERLAVPVVRGPEDDVLGRFAAALGAHPADDVVRLTADCPLLDPAVVLDVVRRHQASGADYTSNTLLRTFPDGLDVEVVTADALRKADDEATERDEREHVTPFAYRRPGRFALDQFTGPLSLGEERWTVDTAEDLAALRTALAGVADPVAATFDDLRRAIPRRSPAAEVVAVPLPCASHRRGEPFVRTWGLRGPDDLALGTAAVTVEDVGVGRLDLRTDPRHEGAALAAVQDRLAQDLQVRTLATPPHGGPP